MAGKITDQVDRSPAEPTDEIPINRGGVDGKVTAQSIADLFDSSSGGAGGGSGGGALVLLEQHTASASASLDFTSCISATYDDYIIRLINIIPASSGADLLMRLSTDGGSSYDSTTIYDLAFQATWPNSSSSGGVTGQTGHGFRASIATTAGYSLNGVLNLYNPGSAALYKTMQHDVTYRDSNVNAFVRNTCGGVYRSTTAVNALRFLMSSGNIASGTIRVYGVAKS